MMIIIFGGYIFYVYLLIIRIINAWNFEMKPLVRRT